MNPDPPTDWLAAAACRPWPAHWWYPKRGDVGHQAKQICAGCPVRTTCLDHAITTGERFGIWGGVGIEQHRHVRSPGGQKQPIRHGTDGGYMAHRRRGEQACPACRHAHTQRVVLYRAERRDGAA